MELFIAIRQMTADSRMISLNTATPQYKVSQLKSELFLKKDTQPKEVCDWWLRLYHADFEKDDVKELLRRLEELN